MDRRRFLLTSVASALAVPLVSGAQQAARLVRIGICSAGQTRSSPLYQAFEQQLRALGYVEGPNVSIEFRSAGGNLELIPTLTRELVGLGVDVLLTAGGEVSIRAAREATSTIPVVMVAVDFDPIASGYVGSLAHPGGNMTGVIFQEPQLTEKRLEVLTQALPKTTRVAVLWDTYAADQVSIAVNAARRLRLQAQPIELRQLPYDYDSALKMATRGRAQALLVLTSPVIFRDRVRFTSLALQSRLPTMLPFPEIVEAGGLMSYGANLTSVFRVAAQYVGRILKGARPADLPIEHPSKFDLVINLKTAKALGLTLPRSLLLRADQVIE
jgi:putative ABC transport system substrate-binding protein